MNDKIQKINWKRDDLWKGCMLATIAHAIMVAHYPEISNEHSWDGMNYSVQDSEGSRGTITFHPEICVGAFRNDNSDRTKTIIRANQYFEGASIDILKLAENETLQYLLDDIDGKISPNITTSFWGIGEDFFSLDSFKDMYKNGVFLLERQLMDLDMAIKSWAEYYDMSLKQCELLKIIFNRKINQRTERITLSKDEMKLIGTNDRQGLRESRISFKEIGITCKKSWNEFLNL